MKWAYGITTVPSRREDLLPRTIESLCIAGFSEPRLFVDGENDPTKYDSFGLEITTHYPNLRTYGNWVVTLWELYLRNPTAERYAVFQDDLVTYKNLRCYLEDCLYPEKGYWNLYTFPENQELAPKDGSIGWYKSNQWGRGAVALMFNREAVKTLLASEHMVGRPEDAIRGWKAVDGGVVSAMKKAGWIEYVHNPSLVQHTGLLSSMRNSPQKLAESFRGENFDALELLKTGIIGLGDMLEKAFSTVGITSQSVEQWLGIPCQCNERKEKLNQLSQWANRILSGKTEQAGKFLYEILSQ